MRNEESNFCIYLHTFLINFKRKNSVNYLINLSVSSVLNKNWGLFKNFRVSVFDIEHRSCFLEKFAFSKNFLFYIFSGKIHELCHNAEETLEKREDKDIKEKLDKITELLEKLINAKLVENENKFTHKIPSKPSLNFEANFRGPTPKHTSTPNSSSDFITLR